jgi:membrane protein implicated in regulation of membrane protease activity
MLPSKKDLLTFELIWSFIFSVIAFYPLINSGNIRFWALIVAIIFALVAFIAPTLLTGFYKIWVKFGEIMGGIISKLILLILFYAIFTPVALMLKILGKDLLHKRLDSQASSYWEERKEQPGTLKNQF